MGLARRAGIKFDEGFLWLSPRGALSSSAPADLLSDPLAEEKVEDKEEEAEGQEADQRGGELVSLGPRNRLDAGLRQGIDQRLVPLWRERSPEVARVIGGVVFVPAGEVLDILVAGDHDFERVTLGVHDVAVLEHLEEFRGRFLHQGGVWSPEEEGAGDHDEGDGHNNGASPIESRAGVTGIARAHFAERVLVWWRHKG